MSFSFESLQLSKPLLSNAKGKCPKCDHRIWFYCPSCLVLADSVHPDSVPQIQLPYTLHIIRDVREASSKSSAIPLSVLAKARFYDSQSVEIQTSAETSALLFPSPDAKCTGDIDWRNVKDVYVIDATWTQAQTLMKSGIFSALQTVKLSAYTTQFWRYNNGQYVDKHNLSTVEAIHYLAKEAKGVDPDLFRETNPDDLLFAYALQFSKIRESRALKGDRIVSGSQVGEKARARRLLSRQKRSPYPTTCAEEHP